MYFVYLIRLHLYVESEDIALADLSRQLGRSPPTVTSWLRVGEVLYLLYNSGISLTDMPGKQTTALAVWSDTRKHGTAHAAACWRLVVEKGSAEATTVLEFNKAVRQYSQQFPRFVPSSQPRLGFGVNFATRTRTLATREFSLRSVDIKFHQETS